MMDCECLRNMHFAKKHKEGLKKIHANTIKAEPPKVPRYQLKFHRKGLCLPT
ncbi:hypothetical protein H920_18114 [Fukomys damarensis]|uniref:60S ribosomal protein L29 n=1 Tax=Fukomys damarensis TaxID=885580 RepID=A0A091DCC2_FUKDA|nr:hypothetical protein H920_18114 [Fukomys damarensis]